MAPMIDAHRPDPPIARPPRPQDVLAAVTQSVSDGVLVLAADGSLLSMNPAAEQLLGWMEGELQGSRLQDMVYAGQARDLPAGARSLPLVLRAAQRRSVHEDTWQRKDETPLSVSYTSMPIIEDDRVTAVVLAVRAVAEQTWAVRELAARARQQAAAADLSQRALASADLPALMDELVALVAHTLDTDHCTILELLPDGTVLLPRAGVGWRDGVVGEALVPAGFESQAGYTLAVGMPVIVEDFRTERRFRADPLLREHGAVSGMAVIIPGQERPYGILSVHTRQPRRFTTDDVHFLEAVGNVLAAAIKRARTEGQLREREAQYRAIFEATSDGVLIGDFEGHVIEANPAACRMYGYAYEELVGLHAAALTHPDSVPSFTNLIREIAAGSIARTRAVNLRKDGSAFPVEAHAGAFAYKGTPHLLIIVRDVTEQVRAYELLEERVAERTQELSAVLEVSHNVASTLELQPLLDLILDQLKRVVDYTGAGIFTVEGDYLLLSGYRGPLPSAQMMGRRFLIADAPGFLETLRRGQPVILDDVKGESPLASAYRRSMNARQYPGYGYIRSFLVVPLKVKERVIGGMRIDHSAPHAFTEHQATLALTIANQAAVAMENARLYAQAQEGAALEERARLARELHDSVTQMLFSASLIAEVLPTLWARDADAGRQQLDGLRLLTRGALAEMRMLLLELRPAALLEADLGDLLRQLTEAMMGRKRLPITVAVEGRRTLPPEAQIALYRIAQEALNNVMKHAGASTVTLSLRCTEDEVDLQVADNGRGFDLAHAGSGRFGLRSMRERAEAIGANVRVESSPGQGTMVHVVWRDSAREETP